MHAGFVTFAFDRCQGQFQGGGGDQAVLLGHGIDWQRQEVEQLVVAEGAQLQLARVRRARLQGIEYALQQHIGGGHQCIGQAAKFLEQLLHQALAAIAAESFALIATDLTGEPLEGFVKAAGAGLADRQFRACTDQRDAAWPGGQQALGQLAAGVAVVADDRTEMGRVQAPVDGDHRQALVLQVPVAVVFWWQATGDEQGVAAAGAEQLLQLALTVGLVIAAGDQQLVTTGTGALFKLFGNTRVAGVLQIRENETQGTGMSAAQARSLRVGCEAMGLDHGTHPFDSAAADALLFGLAIDDVAGSGYGHTSQTGDIAEFHRIFLVITGAGHGARPDSLTRPGRHAQATIVAIVRQDGAFSPEDYRVTWPLGQIKRFS